MTIRYFGKLAGLVLVISVCIEDVGAQCSGSGSPLVSITCTGGGGSDSFVIAVDASGFVTVNGVAVDGPHEAAAVQEITVNGNGGDDLIDASAVEAPDFVNLTSVLLHGGDGDDTIIGSPTGGCGLGGHGVDEYHIATAVSPDLVICGSDAPPPECLFSLPASCSSDASSAVHHYEGFECLHVTSGDGDDQITVDVAGVGVPMLHVDAGQGNDAVALILDELLGTRVNISNKEETTEVSVETEELFFFTLIRQLQELAVGSSSGPGASAKRMTADDHYFTTGLPGVEQFLLGGGGNDTLTVDTLGLGAQPSAGQILFDEAAPISYAEFEDVDLVANPTLPVELTSFDAVTDNDLVKLSWTTATEESNAGFEIEKRFDSGFEAIGFVAGHGTTDQPRRYEYHVEGLAPGRHAFRLRQVDFDGSFSLSNVVEAKIDVPGSHWVAPAYPNPFKSMTGLRLSVATTQTVSVVLYDAIGRPVRWIFDGTLEGGSPVELSIPGKELIPGVYFAQILGESFSATERVVRAR